MPNDRPLRPPLSGKPQPASIPTGWVTVTGWRSHLEKEIITRALIGPYSPLVILSPPSKTWALKLPGGQHGFLVGEGQYKTTILGTEGSRVMGLEFEVDITPYYFPDLQYPKPPAKTSSTLPGFDYDLAVQGMDLFLQ